MKISIALLLSLSLLTLIACQPKGAARTEQETTQADSSFYYVQGDVNDPFIDTVFQKPDSTMTLTKNLYPPAPIASRFKEVEGFRVQIFAGIDQFNADVAYTQAQDMVSDSVYLLRDQGLLKVQVGNYQFRYEADNMRDNFRKNGYEGAWVVQRRITIPVAAEETTVNENVPVGIVDESPAAVQPTASAGKYKIQIMASGSEDRARAKVDEIQRTTSYSSFYEKSGNLFKVFIGYFQEETAAREALSKIRNSGYPDAWLVY